MLRDAAEAATRAPTAEDPVKLTARTRSSHRSAEPITAPEPRSTLKTPGGIPAADAVSASSVATYEDASAGLSTTVFPNAIAGAAFQSGIATGKFHGVMSATAPSGDRSVNCRAPGTWLGITSPTCRTASPA